MGGELNETALILGRIEGELKGINSRLDKVDDMDTRLREVEQKSAINGAVSGGIVSVGLIVIAESLKATFRSHGS